MRDFLPRISSSIRPLPRKRRGGFSLIEVALAIAVVAVALLAVIGLLPAGMSLYSQSAMTSASAQIFERVFADARQADFSKLVYPASPQPELVIPQTFREPKLRYFDAQGDEIIPAGMTLSNEENAKVIYHVNTRILTNATLPVNSNARYLATVTVEIVENPGNRPLSFSGAADRKDLFDLNSIKGMKMKALSMQIAKND